MLTWIEVRLEMWWYDAQVSGCLWKHTDTLWASLGSDGWGWRRTGQQLPLDHCLISADSYWATWVTLDKISWTILLSTSQNADPQWWANINHCFKSLCFRWFVILETLAVGDILVPNFVELEISRDLTPSLVPQCMLRHLVLDPKTHSQAWPHSAAASHKDESSPEGWLWQPFSTLLDSHGWL